MRIDGLLGWDAIRRLDLELDYVARRAVIRVPRPRPGVLPNFMWIGSPFVRCHRTSGVPLLAFLDTGAASSSVTPFFLHKFPDEERRESSQRFRFAGGSAKLPVEILPELAVVVDGSRLEFRDIRAYGRARGFLCLPDLVLGSDFAAHGRLRIDAM